MRKKTDKKGSALIVSFFVLTIILIIALNIALVNVRQRTAAIGGGKSNTAFQNADRGIEEISQAITKGDLRRVNGEIITYVDNNFDDPITCSSGILRKAGVYEVQLFRRNPAGSGSDVSVSCSVANPISDIYMIKSTGISGTTRRTVDSKIVNNETKLLMHFDHEPPNPGDDFIPYDSSYRGRTTTAPLALRIYNNTGVTSAVGGRFDRYASFNGSNQYIQVRQHPDWNLGDEDFTIDAWVYFTNNIAGERTIVGHWDDQDSRRGFQFYFDRSGTGRLGFRYTTDGTMTTEEDLYLSSANSYFSTSGWRHLAVTRKDNNLYLFINGTRRATHLIGSDAIHFYSSNRLTIGAVGNGSGGYMDFFSNRMDELRIIKGTARWTNNFTNWAIPYGPRS